MVLISSVPQPDTAQEKLFALSFLDKNKSGISLVDQLFQEKESTIQTGLGSQINEGSSTEMKQIGLLIGNFALDGISARELLSEALVESSFINMILNDLTLSQTPERIDAVECALWALENLFGEQSKKSYKALSKQVYNVVK